MRRGWVISAAVWGASCASGAVVDPPDDKAGETDVDVATDPPETDGPTDVPDTVPDTDDTSGPPGPQPPVSWGGGLVDLSAPITALGLDVDLGENQVRAPESVPLVVGDLDGDGVEEVLVVRTARSEAERYRVMRWTDAGLVHDPSWTFPSVEGHPSRSIEGVLDLDGDGHSDLIHDDVSRPVHFGDSAGGWSEPLVVEGAVPDWNPQQAHPALVDLDHDGWTDLWMGPTSCQAAPIPLLRVGLRRFEARPDLVPPDAPFLQAVAFATARLADGEDLHFVVAEDCPPTRGSGTYRIGSWDEQGWPHLVLTEPARRDAWWSQRPSTFEATLTGLAAMGAGFGDFDGDGLADLFVTIGIVEQVLITGRGDGTFADAGLDDVMVRELSPFSTPEFPWGVAFPDLDHDGRPDIVTPIGDDSSSWMALRGHPLRNTVYWNGGDLQLVEVGSALGLTQVGSWQSMGVFDPDDDGDADFAMGGFGADPVVYRNDIVVEGRSGLAVTLRGTTSDRFAVGARIAAEVSGLPTHTAWHGALANPSSLSPPAVYLGTGTHGRVDRLEIDWPSGWTQVLRDIPADQHLVVEEPPVVVVRPEGRRVAVGQAVDVVVLARNPDGTLDADATVALEVVGVRASVAGPFLAEGGRGFQLASTTAGTAQLRITIDGQPLVVRPRVWWD